jgi:hypothetical protein
VTRPLNALPIFRKRAAVAFQRTPPAAYRPVAGVDAGSATVTPTGTAGPPAKS